MKVKEKVITAYEEFDAFLEKQELVVQNQQQVQEIVQDKQELKIKKKKEKKKKKELAINNNSKLITKEEEVAWGIIDAIRERKNRPSIPLDFANGVKVHDTQRDAMIISVFPGCGKENFCYHYDTKSIFREQHYLDFLRLHILDIDTTKYMWVLDKDNNITDKNPNFPNNFINVIKENIPKMDIIFVPSDTPIRKALEYANLPYIIIYPSVKYKSDLIRTIISERHEYKFIKYMEENFEKLIAEIDEESFPMKVKFPFIMAAIKKHNAPAHFPTEGAFTVKEITSIELDMMYQLLPEYEKYRYKIRHKLKETTAVVIRNNTTEISEY